MKILFVIPTLGTGGAERVASILANHFCEKNEVKFFLMENSEVERYPIDNKVVIYEAGIRVKRGNKIKVIVNFVLSFLYQKRLLQNKIYDYHPDILISFLPKADMLAFSVNGNHKWIASERNDPTRRSWPERKVLNLVYKKTDVMVCQTRNVACYYKEKNVKNTCVIGNPLLSENSLTVESRENYVVAVGRLDKQKNYSMLIKAFAAAKKNKEIKEKLYIIGNGPQQKELQNLIYSLKMEKDILLLGRKSNVRDYLIKARAFILSSDYEGLPNAMLEAMDAGLPIISTDFFTGAAKEFVNEENGYIVPVGDGQAMKHAIENLLSKEKSQLEQMGKISKQRVKKLDAEKISKQWDRMLIAILKKRKVKSV